MMNLKHLTTETRNPESIHIDSVNTATMVKMMNTEDKKVATAVEKVLPKIAQAIEKASERFIDGGRLIYCGAGTSGRLGTLDAIELTPTYGIPVERAFGIIAGKKEAMFHAVEGAEDSKELAIEDLQEVNVTDKDIVIAIAASGRTPYAISAIEYGNKVGALTISVTCNGRNEMEKLSDIAISPIVGPEVITGSTRMKAGTAQKMILNMLSTGIMIRAGKVYENLMIHMQPTNEKLIERSIGIIQEVTGAPYEKAKEYLQKADKNVGVAIVMLKMNISKESAIEALNQYNGRVVDVLKEEKGG